MLSKFIKMLVLLVPNKKYRRKLRNKYVYGFDNKQIDLINENYKENIKKIKKKYGKEKIKVGFLISENQKWNCQSVYDEMKESTDFEPIILITKVFSDKYEDFGKFYASLEENYNFFKNRKMNVEYAYDINKKEYLDINTFGIDILFYQQPWAITKEQDIPVTSKFALTCYVPYGVAMINSPTDYDLIFYKTLWHQYVINNTVYEYLKQNGEACVENYRIVGHPKFDKYLKEKNIEKQDYIIYAPHHSFAPSHLNFATFKWNGKYILEYAKSHPNLKFVFKPHPQLKTRLIKRKIMTEQQVDNYYKEWKNIAVFCDDGDYFDLFAKSKLMITDCCSFLGEYFPTKNPVINLKNKNSVKHNKFGQLITDCYYKVYDLKTLKEVMNNILEENKDPMREQRMKMLKELDIINTPASKRILETIRKEIK